MCSRSGIFRGALDCGATAINEEMKLAAATAISSLVTAAELKKGMIIPSPLDRKVGEAVAIATAKAAMKTGVAGISLDEAGLFKKIRENLKG